MREQVEDKLQFLDLLEKYLVIELACKAAGVPRSTIYRWMENDPEFKRQVRSAGRAKKDKVNDLAESVIITNILKKDMGAAKFWLTHNHPSFITHRPPQKQLPAGQIKGSKQIAPTLPKDAYQKIAIGRLVKKIRRKVVRQGMRIYDAVQESLNEVAQQDPRFSMNVDIRLIPWDEILKLALEKEQQS